MIDGGLILRGIASKAAGFLSGFTWKFWLIAIAIVLAAAGAQTVRLSWAQAKIAKMEAAQEKAARKAVERAREADDTAGQVSAGRKQQIEEGNERAKEAARNSDDPLRDGLNSLR